MNVGILIPHIFAQEKLLNKVIFTPIFLARALVNTLKTFEEIENVYLFTPGKIETSATNVTTDLSYLEKELEIQGCTLDQLINESPMAFVSLSRQINAQITAEAFQYAKDKKIDVLHVFMCEDEIPLYFANLLDIPLLFTHHDPYNFYRKYRARFPILKNLNYVSISLAQRNTSAAKLNFIANVYNGINLQDFPFNNTPKDYFCFIGRIVQNKGCHIAIEACKNTGNKLKIAGKHYNDNTDDGENYWAKYIKPYINKDGIEYLEYLKTPTETAPFFANAKALLFPVTWDEPFGVVMVEALASGTPVIAFNNGAVPEIIENGKNGFIVKDEKEMEEAMRKIDTIDRAYCRKSAEKFSTENMAKGYLEVYKKLMVNGEQ
jgi:glycosyltransferase involved in cell wall biosynthesis